MTSTRTSRLFKASPDALYAAFLDPAVLVTWLPPAEMTGHIHKFDARVGGGYRMSLFYPPSDFATGKPAPRGKTTDREDRVNVRFVERVPTRRIVEAVTFDTVDPTLQGEMTITVTFEEQTCGTEVTFLSTNLPPGLQAEDNEAGARLPEVLDRVKKLGPAFSLSQLISGVVVENFVIPRQNQLQSVFDFGFTELS